jgi:hypothetical protein
MATEDVEYVHIFGAKKWEKRWQCTLCINAQKISVWLKAKYPISGRALK